MNTQTATGYAHLDSSNATDAARELPPAIAADSGHVEVRGVGGIGYYKDVSGEGPAVVLIHSVNAAASAYEMRPLFEAFRGRRRVFALDLPGFGRSQRGDRDYGPARDAEALERVIVGVASPHGDPRDAVALRDDVAAMRARMRGELDRSAPARFDLKQGEGGLVDLEFLLQFIVLRDAARERALLEPRDTPALLDAACAAGALGVDACDGLRDAHAVLLDAGLRCTLDRRMRLVPEDEAIAAARAAVRDAWKAIGLG